MSQPNRRRGRRARRGVLHYIGVGLSGGVLALVTAVAALLIVVPWAAGAVPLTILTSSMEPGLPPGSLIVVKPTPIDEISIGSIVTYQIASGRPEVITHRVTAVVTESNGGRSFVTQGDNNPEPDPALVIPEQVKGTVWYSVPLVGYLATGLDQANRSWIVVAVAVGLLAYAAWMLASGLRPRKRRGAPAGRLS